LGDHAVTSRHDLTNQEEAEIKVPTSGRWNKPDDYESSAAFGNLPKLDRPFIKSAGRVG
jgi:hypothetical protein